MPHLSQIPFIDLAADLAGQRKDCDAAIKKVLDSGRFLLGEELLEFENEFATYNGSSHAIGVASGLTALKLMLQACGIGPGDEIIVPANTYIATWLSISAVGACPVPAEPDPETRNINPLLLDPLRTERTKAVLAVHLYGSPCNMDALRSFCDEYGLLLLIDAAHSCGAEWKNERRACLGDAAAFSFYPTKNLGAFGDAGAVVTDNPDYAERVRLLRNYGMRDRYFHPMKGENARMDELQAAVLRVRLKILDKQNAKRRELASLYQNLLTGNTNLKMQKTLNDATSVYHLFTITLPKRDRVAETLAEQGIETAIHYPVPPHHALAYRNDGDWPSLPITETMADQLLSLPLYPSLENAAAIHIAESLLIVLTEEGN